VSDGYPFTAIVEQERLTTALLLNAVNPAVGGVLVSGPSGTGKSTAVRGLAALLPEIEVVADCPFGCDPARPCALCAERRARGERLEARTRRVRIVTLPLNATEDRVAGSVDIAQALREGIAALRPGLLAEANRGILYVDEINLLDDHLCDVLLDAAAMGVNAVEREGVSIEHPARFLLVGTMNPEEGELRPQIADRIGLHVVVEGIAEPAVRAEVLRRREAFTADPVAFAAAWAGPEADLAERLRAARASLAAVAVPDELYGAIAQLVTRSGVISHRADVTVLECAKALAALDGRSRVTREDVLDAARLALGHRVAIDPFDANAGIDDRLLRRILDDVLDVDLEEEDTRKKAPGPVGPSSTAPSS
jgi:Mg-chelatase subunit ChlI